jgi:hypothetical protein
VARLEGARRVKMAGKMIGLLGCTLTTIFWIIATNNMSVAAAFGVLFFWLLPSLAIGIIIWIAGWVIEGFKA